MPGVMDEYLVKLGFIEDTVGFARFAAALRGTTSLVDLEFMKMGKTVLAWQVGAVGAFAAVGAAALKIADNTAAADQEYRLLALHMYTSLPVARELSIALKALGQPLENVMWDKELSGRFNQLVKDQRAMTQELGPDFESQMIKIRDVRFEVTRLGVELEYLTMNVVQNLARIFGTNIDDVLGKLRDFNDWFISNMPAIADSIATNLKPILEDVGAVMESLWGFTKQLVVEFTNLVALFSGDDSLKTTTADFGKMATAIRRVVDGIALSIAAMFQLGSNILLLLDAAGRAAVGDFAGAKKDLHDMKPLTEGPGEQIIDRAVRDQIAKRGDASGNDIKSMIVGWGKMLGVSPQLALSVAQAESNYRQFDKNGNVLMSGGPNSHAMGVFQLQPGTARMMGVDPKDTAQNIFGGVAYLKYLLNLFHGDERMALEHYYGSNDPKKNAAYASRVMQIESGIRIGTLTVNVPGGGSKDSVKSAVIDALQEAAKQRTQRNIAQFQSPQWSY